MAKPNYYQVLGVSKTATEDEIKQAYRKLAREFHPDVNSSPDAEDKFKEINAAYGTLSDSLKRADYDQSLSDTGVRRDSARPGSSGPRPPGADAYQQTYGPGPSDTASDPNPYRSAMIRAALARTLFLAFGVGIAGTLIRIGLSSITEDPIDVITIVSGFLPAFLMGGLYAADMNFKVETFLGTGWVGRSYTFGRTIIMSLSLAFYLGLLGAAFDRLSNTGLHLIAPPLALFGVLAGAVIGSDGDTPEKIRSAAGRFNMFYTFLRGAEVGILGGIIGAALGGILATIGIGGVWQWSVFIGFSLGMIIGSIKPPNLAAYASYASASVKNVMIMLMVLVALLAGVGFGVAFQPVLSTYFKLG